MHYAEYILIGPTNVCRVIHRDLGLIVMLDTDQLRSFLAIVDAGSFTRAAERVNKTQSAVSMHIRRLEEQLGCALFVKQGLSGRVRFGIPDDYAEFHLASFLSRFYHDHPVVEVSVTCENSVALAALV